MSLVSLSFLPSSNVPLSLPPFFLLPSRFSSVPLSLLPSPTLHMATRGPMTGFLCRAFSPIDACLQLYGAQGSRGTQGSRVLAYRDSRVSRGKSSDASLMCPRLASHVSRLHRKPYATLEEWQEAYGRRYGFSLDTLDDGHVRGVADDAQRFSGSLLDLLLDFRNILPEHNCPYN